MSNEATITYIGRATGPTQEMLAAAPYESFGFWVLVAAYTLSLACAFVLAFKGRARGSRLTISGLLVVLLYFVFQNTLAQDAELLFSPWGTAVASITYGLGAFLIALGYARLAVATLRAGRAR